MPSPHRPPPQIRGPPKGGLASRVVDNDHFREELLALMERKEHWAWPAFSRGLVPRDKLHIHLEQEYDAYVRDFPVMVGRAYVQCPLAAVRRDLAANLYEEETGGLAAGRPHPELFLEYPRGLGMDVARFASITPLAATRRYRAWLDEATTTKGWEAAAAVTTIFLEGTRFERGELDPNATKRPEPPLEAHPLVLHYGLPLEALALTKAHRSVEGGHRRAAWAALLDHGAPSTRTLVVDVMRETLSRWLAFRDDVALACGLRRAADGGACLAGDGDERPTTPEPSR